MCVVSMVADNFRDRWPNIYPGIMPLYPPSKDEPKIPDIFKPKSPEVSKEDFDNLKREVELLKDLLKRAKAYDIRNNEPNCELEEKMQFLRAIAALVGVDLDDVIGK